MISTTLEQQRTYLYLHIQTSKCIASGALLRVTITPHLAHWVEMVTLVVNEVFTYCVSGGPSGLGLGVIPLNRNDGNVRGQRMSCLVSQHMHHSNQTNNNHCIHIKVFTKYMIHKILTPKVNNKTRHKVTILHLLNSNACICLLVS